MNNPHELKGYYESLVRTYKKQLRKYKCLKGTNEESEKMHFLSDELHTILGKIESFNAMFGNYIRKRKDSFGKFNVESYMVGVYGIKKDKKSKMKGFYDGADDLVENNKVYNFRNQQPYNGYCSPINPHDMNSDLSRHNKMMSSGRFRSNPSMKFDQPENTNVSYGFYEQRKNLMPTCDIKNGSTGKTNKMEDTLKYSGMPDVQGMGNNYDGSPIYPPPINSLYTPEQPSMYQYGNYDDRILSSDYNIQSSPMMDFGAINNSPLANDAMYYNEKNSPYLASAYNSPESISAFDDHKHEDEQKITIFDACNLFKDTIRNELISYAETKKVDSISLREVKIMLSGKNVTDYHLGAVNKAEKYIPFKNKAHEKY